MTPSTFRRLALSLVALACGFAGGLVGLGYAPVLAGVCPPCFGLQDTGGDVYLDTRDPAAVEAVHARLADARARVEAEMGPLTHNPRWVGCLGLACARWMGAQDAQALAYMGRLVYVSPWGFDTDILAHEMSHVELHSRLSGWEIDRFPAWLDEGIATYVSQDARFDLQPDTCTAPLDALPLDQVDWRDLPHGEVDAAYGLAGCFVSKWMHAHPVSGLDGLIEAALDGTLSRERPND